MVDAANVKQNASSSQDLASRSPPLSPLPLRSVLILRLVPPPEPLVPTVGIRHPYAVRRRPLGQNHLQSSTACTQAGTKPTSGWGWNCERQTTEVPAGSADLRFAPAHIASSSLASIRRLKFQKRRTPAGGRSCHPRIDQRQRIYKGGARGCSNSDELTTMTATTRRIS